MASTRRIGSETSASRDAIIKGAIQVLQEQGAANLTAANIAKVAGVKAHLVHYYFRSIDDLIVAVVRSYGSLGLKNTAKAIASEEPLRALWDIEISSKWGAGVKEMGAIASRREPVRAEMARSIEDMRSLQVEGINRQLQLSGFEPPLPAEAMTLIVVAIARQIISERILGVTLGHEEAIAAVEGLLATLPRTEKKSAAKPGSESAANCRPAVGAKTRKPGRRNPPKPS